jgi:hypothetical protein
MSIYVPLKSSPQKIGAAVEIFFLSSIELEITLGVILPFTVNVSKSLYLMRVKCQNRFNTRLPKGSAPTHSSVANVLNKINKSLSNGKAFCHVFWNVS